MIRRQGAIYFGRENGRRYYIARNDGTGKSTVFARIDGLMSGCIEIGRLTIGWYDRRMLS